MTNLFTCVILLQLGYSKLIAGEDFQESSMMVHPMYLAEIIGKGGCNIRAIQEATRLVS